MSPNSPPAQLLDVLIVGSGLSGLVVAHQLHKTLAVSFKLLEARNVLGGRLVNDDAGKTIDLGGAWIWPSHQPHMKRLASSLKINTFTQPDDDASTRIVGGAIQFIHRLAETLPSSVIQLNTPVSTVKLTNVEDKIPVVQVETATNETFLARRVVFCVPPRLIDKQIVFDPPLSKEKQVAFQQSNTWMAGVTKVGLVYPNRFWERHASDIGFPGGPAFQVYDASTKNDNVAALTFFALQTNGDDDDESLAKQCAFQIKNVWSHYRKPYADKAMDFVEFHVQAWPKEKYISENPTPIRINPHPKPVHALSTNEWNDLLLFAGSETDRSSPGVMEGAVGAAMRVVKDIQSYFSATK